MAETGLFADGKKGVQRVSDYAVWQREWLSGERLKTQADYWRQSLAGAPVLLELPTNRLDVRLSGGSAVLWVADQPGPRLGCIAEPRQIERHRPSLSFAADLPSFGV